MCTSSESTLNFIIACIEKALEKSNRAKVILKYIIYNINKKLTGKWSCIIGHNFAANVKTGHECIILKADIMDSVKRTFRIYKIAVFEI